MKEKSKKKLIKVFIAFIILTFAISINLISFADGTGTITGQTVKLRQKASTDSAVVTLLSVNDKVLVSSKEGDWYKVTFDGKTGYVYKDYIKTSGVSDNSQNNTNSSNTNSEGSNLGNSNTTNNSQSNNSATDSQNSGEQASNNVNNTTNTSNSAESSTTDQSGNSTNLTGTEQILLNDSDIKILPLINSDTIGGLKKGDKVSILDDVNNWIYINYTTLSGWIRKDMVVNMQDNTNNSPNTTNAENASNQVADNTTNNVSANTVNNDESNTNSVQTSNNEKNNTSSNANDGSDTNTSTKYPTTKYVTTESLNVRRKPDASSDKVGVVTKNSKVTVESVDSNGWAKITLANGTKGYISNIYLSDKSK